MTQQEYNLIKEPLKEAEILLQKIEIGLRRVRASFGTKKKILKNLEIYRNLQNKFTQTITKCVTILAQQKYDEEQIDFLNQYLPFSEYRFALDVYKKLFKNKLK